MSNKLIGILWNSPYTNTVLKEVERISKEQEIDDLDRVALERDIYGFLKDTTTRNIFDNAYQKLKEQYIEELEFDFSAGLLPLLTLEEVRNILECAQGLTDVIYNTTDTKGKNIKEQADIIARKTLATTERTRKNLELITIPREV